MRRYCPWFDLKLGGAQKTVIAPKTHAGHVAFTEYGMYIFIDGAYTLVSKQQDWENFNECLYIDYGLPNNSV